MSEDEAEEVAAPTRGANHSCAEDPCLAKAFIGASEDPIVGANQRSPAFKKKHYDEFCSLIDVCNSRNHTNCSHRTQQSAIQRWKKMSRWALKLLGTEKSCGDPPSGDSDKEEWCKRVRKAYVQRSADAKNFMENVDTCREFLADHPKWIAHEEENEVERNKPKRPRPEGNKKAKEKKADKDFVMNCLANSSTAGDSAEESNKKQRHPDKKEGFMDTLQVTANTIAGALQGAISQSNQQQDITNKLQMINSPHLSELQKKTLMQNIHSTVIQHSSGADNEVDAPPVVMTTNNSTDASEVTTEQFGTF